MNRVNVGKGIPGLLSCLAILFVACDSGKGPSDPVEPLLGTWNFTGVSYKREVTTLPASDEYPPSTSESIKDVTGKEYYIEFNSDQSYTASFPSAISAGKAGGAEAAEAVNMGSWSRKDSLLTLIRDGTAKPDTTRMTIRTESGSATLTSSTSFSYTVAEGYTSTSVTTIAYFAEKEANP